MTLYPSISCFRSPVPSNYVVPEQYDARSCRYHGLQPRPPSKFDMQVRYVAQGSQKSEGCCVYRRQISLRRRLCESEYRHGVLWLNCDCLLRVRERLGRSGQPAAVSSVVNRLRIFCGQPASPTSEVNQLYQKTSLPFAVAGGLLRWFARAKASI